MRFCEKEGLPLVRQVLKNTPQPVVTFEGDRYDLARRVSGIGFYAAFYPDNLSFLRARTSLSHQIKEYFDTPPPVGQVKIPREYFIERSEFSRVGSGVTVRTV